MKREKVVWKWTWWRRWVGCRWTPVAVDFPRRRRAAASEPRCARDAAYVRWGCSELWWRRSVRRWWNWRRSCPWRSSRIRNPHDDCRSTTSIIPTTMLLLNSNHRPCLLHLHQGGYIIASVCPFLFVCLSVCPWAGLCEAIFMKPFKIIDYCRTKYLSNFGVGLVQNDWMAAILDFRYCTLRTTYFHRHSLGGTST